MGRSLRSLLVLALLAGYPSGTAQGQAADPISVTAHLDFKDPIGDDPESVVARFDVTLAFHAVQDSALTLTLVGTGAGVSHACLAGSQKDVFAPDSVRLTKITGAFDAGRVVCGAEKIEGNTQEDCQGEVDGPYFGEGENPENGRWFCVGWQVEPLSGSAATLEVRQMPRTLVADRTCPLLQPARCGLATGIAPDGPALAGFLLEPGFPNPFNPVTHLSYHLPTPQPVRLAVYDLTGQLVKTLDHTKRSAGRHTATWNGTTEEGRRVASGLYLVRLHAGNFVAHRTVLLVR